jgi:hypothetical protein
VVDKQWGIWLGLHKANGDQVGGKAVVLSLECLLQVVEGLVEPIHQLMVSGINKVGGLVAVDYLGDGVIEEGIFDI